MTVALTRLAGEFVATLDYRSIPQRALATAKNGFTDCVATAIAGAGEEVTRIVLESIASRGRDGEAALLVGTERANAPDAALVNGVAGHVLDYDDVANEGHPSVTLVPAILAEGEALGCSGADALAAYVAGYELWCDLSMRDADPHHHKGWHPTGVFGAIAAAAACARLRRLDAERTRHAIGLGASMSAGLTSNFGSMAKSFHAGRAAQSGVLAARLAAAGMTASPDALEHAPGFVAAISPHGKIDLEREPAFGREWGIERFGLNIKLYPVCYCCQRALDALFALHAARPFAVQEVRRITARMSPTSALILKNHRPQTGLDAKFSIEFALAAALIAGKVGLDELTDAFVRRAEVQALIPLIGVEPLTEPDPEMPAFSLYEEVAVELAGGETLTSPQVRCARGHVGNPLSRDELWQKFRECLGPRFAAAQAQRMFDLLQNLERVSALGEIAHALAPLRPARAAG